MQRGQQGREKHDPDVVEEISLKTGFASLAARGIRVSDLVSLGLAAGLSAVFFVVWAHASAAEKHSSAMTNAMVEQSSAIRALTRAQILTTCVMAMPMERRESELKEATSFCRRLAELP